MNKQKYWHSWLNGITVAGIVLMTTLSWAAVRPPPAQAAPARHAPAQAVTPSTTITIEGVITSMNDGVWVVGGVTVIVTPQTVITGNPVVGNVVQIMAVADGDDHLVAQTITVIAITATQSPTPPATQVATPVVTAVATQAVTPVPYVIIVIEGPVEEINIDVNVIVVYGQRIKLHPNDPLLAKLKIGDWVHVDGDFETDTDNTIIVVVVNIIIINPPPSVIIVAPPSGNDNCGHKHKDCGDEGDD